MSKCDAHHIASVTGGTRGVVTGGTPDGRADAEDGASTENLPEPFGADHAGEVSRDGRQEGDAEVGEEHHGEDVDRGRDAGDQADGTEGA